MKTIRRISASQTIVVEVSEAEWELIADQEHRLVALEQACAHLDDDNLYSSLQRLVKALPLAVNAEMASVRLLSSEGDALHLVAREGLPSRHIRDLALNAIPRAKQRSIFALGGHHSEARALGLRYLAGEWLRSESEVVGSLTIGCRTERRPSPGQRQLVTSTAALLGPRLRDVDRTERSLRSQSLALARAAILEPPDIPEGPLRALRPREATVLDLYANGGGVDEIAALLVISPHTVRTHIKLAFRRLGIHSREEAAELVQANSVIALL